MTKSPTYPQGGDAQAIKQVANVYYGGYTNMFEAHRWPERSTKIMPAVQSRVVETYGSVRAFEDAHKRGDLDFPMEAITSDPPNVWLTSFYGFGPWDWGFLGFADERRRENFIEESKPGVLVVIYGATKAYHREDRYQVLGVVQCSRDIGNARSIQPRRRIIHIPSVNSRESTKDKIWEVEHIIEELGDWQGTDPATGFQLVKTTDGRVLRIADLVDDDASKRDRVSAALKDSAQKNNRDHVDIIIALGMAKEGFDWIWCEHALTVGYRSSLTEIVQIIGRATRDAPGKTRARFTNLIAEPDASEEAVTEAVNDTLKAIAASLLMEQVLAPRFNFTPKNPGSGPIEGFDYGEGGYDPEKCNVGFNDQTGQFQIEIKGLAEPKSKEAARICQEDLNEVIAAFVQDKTAIERGLFDEELVPEELTQVRLGKIIKDKYPELDEDDQEAVRQHAIAALSLTQQAKQVALESSDAGQPANTALVDGVRKFAMDVRELDIDLIDRINPFGEAYAILAKTMSEESLKQVAAAIAAKRTSLSPDEAKELAVRAVKFKKERGRLPSISSTDAWEKRMAEGAAAFVRFKDEGRYE